MTRGVALTPALSPSWGEGADAHGEEPQTGAVNRSRWPDSSADRPEGDSVFIGPQTGQSRCGRRPRPAVCRFEFPDPCRSFSRPGRSRGRRVDGRLRLHHRRHFRSTLADAEVLDAAQNPVNQKALDRDGKTSNVLHKPVERIDRDFFSHLRRQHVSSMASFCCFMLSHFSRRCRPPSATFSPRGEGTVLEDRALASVVEPELAAGH